MFNINSQLSTEFGHLSTREYTIAAKSASLFRALISESPVCGVVGLAARILFLGVLIHSIRVRQARTTVPVPGASSSSSSVMVELNGGDNELYLDTV